MSASQRVRLSDVEQLLTLVNEAHDITAYDLPARKQHLLSGLCRLTGAQVAILNLLVVEGKAVAPRLVASHDQGWSGDAERRVLHDYYQQQLYRIAGLCDPVDEFAMGRLTSANVPLAVQREELLSDHEWYRNPAVNEFRRRAGINQFVQVSNPAFGRKYIGTLGVHRPWKSRRFTLRERQLVELFNLAILWLHNGEARQLAQAKSLAPAGADPSALAMPPRVRRVMDLLLEGHGEKQVAARLGLSRHTVHQYVKLLYAALGVGSRGELLARFVRR